LKKRFKWIKWNIEHIAKHGVSTKEAESAFKSPAPGYPRRHGDGYILWGKSYLARWLQIGFHREADDRIFIFHARPLTKNERRQIR